MAKVVKPNLVEKMLIQKRLQAKYPQMYKKGWGKPVDKITAQLRKAGVSESKIAKMKGKKK